jgi:hypothetical protein
LIIRQTLRFSISTLSGFLEITRTEQNTCSHKEEFHR